MLEKQKITQIQYEYHKDNKRDVGYSFACFLLFLFVLISPPFLLPLEREPFHNDPPTSFLLSQTPSILLLVQNQVRGWLCNKETLQYVNAGHWHFKRFMFGFHFQLTTPAI